MSRNFVHYNQILQIPSLKKLPKAVFLSSDRQQVRPKYCARTGEGVIGTNAARREAQQNPQLQKGPRATIQSRKKSCQLSDSEYSPNFPSLLLFSNNTHYLP